MDVNGIISSLIIAVIGACATIATHFITKSNGRRRSRQESQQKSLKCIVNVYEKGEYIDSMEKAIREADELCIFTIAASNFVTNLHTVITSRLAMEEPFAMRLLLADGDSEFSKVVQMMENQILTHIKTNVSITYARLDEYYAQGKNVHPRFRIKLYSTEFRNNVIICKRDKRIQCWVGLVMPNRWAVDSPMFEMDAKTSELYYSFFDDLWKGKIYDNPTRQEYKAYKDKFKLKDYVPPEETGSEETILSKTR